MNGQRCRGTARRAGNVLALVAVCLVAIIGVTGLVLDSGRMMVQRRHAQSMVDAAAEAGAIALFVDRSDVIATAEARAYADSNRYIKHDAAGDTLVVNIPPKSGSFKDNPSYVEVLATQRVETLFMRAVPWSSDPKWVTVQTRAVAGFAKRPAPDGIIVLDPVGASALDVIRTNLDVEKGRIQVNSRHHSMAATGSRGARIDADEIRLVGGYRENSGSRFLMTPTTGVSAAEDPLSTLPAPEMAGIVDHKRIEILSASDWVKKTGSRTVTLEPGVYTGGIKIDADLDINFKPGNVIINGGGLYLKTNRKINADRTFVFNGGSPDCGNTFAALFIDADADCTFTPPTDGTYKGITFYQDRANIEEARISIDTNKRFRTGAMYFASASISLESEGNTDGTIVIAHRFRVFGRGDAKFKFDENSGPSSAIIAIVE